MAKNRVTRKQLLKEPDEFLNSTGRLIEWARGNAKSLLWGGVIFLALVILSSAYGYFQARWANAAEVMLGQALAKYQNEIQTKDAQAALAVVRSDFDTLLNSYGSQPAGRLGEVIYGNVCLAGQAYDDAIAHYTSALTTFGADPSLSNIILNGLGTAYLEKGDYTQALEQLKKIADGSGSVFKDAALFNLGRLYTQLGKTEEGRQAYERLSADFPQSMYADLAKEQTAGS